MHTLTLNDGKRFEIAFAAPVSITENVVFLAKVLNSTPDEIHNAFKNHKATSTITISYTQDDPEEVTAVYTGYVVYAGFTVDSDGSILVRLKKNVG